MQKFFWLISLKEENTQCNDDGDRFKGGEEPKSCTECDNGDILPQCRMMMTMRYDDKYDHDDDADIVDDNDDLKLLEAAGEAAGLAAKRPVQVNHLPSN